MAAPKQTTYNGFQQGDYAVRKGRLCTIKKIHWTTDPPDVTVTMLDDNTDVGTEFSRLSKPTDEDMLKLPMQKQSSDCGKKPTLKRSFFDAFFEERAHKYKHGNSNTSTKTTNTAAKQSQRTTSTKNTSHSATNNSGDSRAHDVELAGHTYKDDRTFEDLLSDGPPRKKRKVSASQSPDSIAYAQGWMCDACTVENPDMDRLKCYLCDTPRTFAEKLKYAVDQDSLKKENHVHTEEKKEATNSSQVEQKQKQKQVTFITWNVWFQHEVALMDRMKAIGCHIVEQAADIVCFQEITPLILDIMQSSKWYKSNGYQSTILPSHSHFNGLSYYNVVMTKHELMRDAIAFKYFENTCMGRHLIIAPVKLPGGHVVCAATSHLESPVGTWAGGKKDKYSAERKEQLAYSLSALDQEAKSSGNGNVIFGGDFNWCRPTKNTRNDGELKQYLGASWLDCWHELHPDKVGYTYDAKTNGMLSGYLQNRLDRVVYKKDGQLRLRSIEMLGREAIPNVCYEKVFKRKNGNETKMLPVLPSDHYGLVARFDIV